VIECQSTGGIRQGTGSCPARDPPDRVRLVRPEVLRLDASRSCAAPDLYRPRAAPMASGRDPLSPDRVRPV